MCTHACICGCIVSAGLERWWTRHWTVTSENYELPFWDWLFVFQLEEEFSLLAGGLGLLSASFQPSTSMNSAVCLEWNINVFELISQWCSELLRLADTPSQQAMVSFIPSLVDYHLWMLVRLTVNQRNYFNQNNFVLLQSLLVQDTHWSAPRLLQLPDNYNTIFQYYHRKSCTVCNKTPKDPAVCLVCGAFVCLKGLCCKQQGVCECVLVSADSL